jgi:hypothetical protein
VQKTFNEVLPDGQIIPRVITKAVTATARRFRMMTIEQLKQFAISNTTVHFDVPDRAFGGMFFYVGR